MSEKIQNVTKKQGNKRLNGGPEIDMVKSIGVSL